MATNPQWFEEEEDLNLDWSQARLPGYTVDELLRAGDPEGTRRELYRLIQEGQDSGPGQQIGEDWIDQTLARARARAAERIL